MIKGPLNVGHSRGSGRCCRRGCSRVLGFLQKPGWGLSCRKSTLAKHGVFDFGVLERRPPLEGSVGA